MRQILKSGQDRILSYDCVKRMWYCARDGWNIGKRFVAEVHESDGFKNKVNLVKLRLHQGWSQCKQRVMHHPCTDSLKRKWGGLSEDWKHVLAISVLVVLLLVDVQHKDGLVQSVIFPVFSTFFFIFHELLVCLANIVVHLYYCSYLCTMDVVSILVDVTVETLVSVAEMIVALGGLLLTMARGLIQLVTVTVGTTATLIHVFILLYYRSYRNQADAN